MQSALPVSVAAQALTQLPWATAALLFVTGLAMSLPGLPFDWFEQFRLEQEFGFNTTTQKIWWLDRVKGLDRKSVV